MHINRGHDGRAIGQRHDQTVTRQPNKRLTHGGAGHGETLGKGGFVQELAGRQGKRQNLIAQGFIGKARAGAFQASRLGVAVHLAPPLPPYH